jgi:two-component sensor histidine kinase
MERGRVSCERVLPHALPAGDEVQEIFHLHLDPLPRLVAAAREFVAEHAPPLPAETQEALLLLTSELVTNAVLHARTPLEVGIAVADDSVLVSVFDHDLTRTSQQPYPRREGGWGLGLVSALAEESALEPHADGGKTAWFRLPRGELPVLHDAVAARPESSQSGDTA